MRQPTGSPDFSEGSKALLDEIGARYGADPESVTRWSPYRLGLALECLDAGRAMRARHMGGGGILALLTLLKEVLLG